MRNAFADEITRIADEDERVVMLSADIGNRLFDKFRENHPTRFYNCGVAEANMISLAAGLASSGLRPVCYTITPFITTRCFEQIRVDVCYHEMPVVIVGTGAGLSYASLGSTHHSLEDLALLRTLPGMSVLAPADSIELRSCLRSAVASDMPTYTRIGKKGEPAVFTDRQTFEFGRWREVRAGSDACVLAVGNMVSVAIDAAAIAAERGISVKVMSCASVKPLDTAFLDDAWTRFRVIATVEEHGAIGGFGAAVAEWLVDRRTPVRVPLLRFAAADEFLHDPGEQAEAREYLGLTAEHIARGMEQALRAS